MTSKILLDFTATKSMNNGLGQFSRSLGNAIIKLKPSTMYIDVLIPKGNESLFPDADGYRYKNSLFRDSSPYFLKFFFQHKWKYDLWHLTNQNSGFIPLDTHTPMLLTIHDLNFLRESKSEELEEKISKVQKIVDRATTINTISYFVKEEVNNTLKIHNKFLNVIYNGGIEKKPYPNTEPQLENLDFKQPFLFSIGEFLPKKNFIVLLEMLQFLPEFQLCIAGKNTTEYANLFQSKLKELNLEARVHLLGCITEQHRSWLYQNMTAFVFPSLTEGFGLPIIEAMSYAKPIFCSNLTSLPEIGGPFPYYWKNFEPQYMAQKVREGLIDAKKNADHLKLSQSHAETFNWDRAASEYLNLYDRILMSQKRQKSVVLN